MSQETREFAIIPLTPIHIGAGRTLSPEEYFIGPEGLCRFNPVVVLRCMSREERLHYEKLLDAASMKEALTSLRNAAKKYADQTVVYRAPLGDRARRELERAGAEESSSGEVSLLPHTISGEAVSLPGSAIKGALRTAVLSALLEDDFANGRQREQQILDQIEETDPRRISRYAQDLQAAIFGVPGESPIPADPFRHLSVSDARIPSAFVRIDRFEIVHVDPERDAKGIQLNLERLRSVADGLEKPVGTIRIQLRESRFGNPRTSIKRVLTWDFLLSAAHYFFHGRWAAERKRFPFVYHATQPTWWTQIPPGSLLLRVGRFCHFESLSLDRIRRGVQAGQRGRPSRPLYESGATRTVCHLQNGQTGPCGWLLLKPLETKQ